MRLKGESRATQWLIFAALVVIVPVALYHLVEHTAIKFGNLVGRRLKPSASIPSL